jgi:membrane protein DedA with SNARE-associated domain
MDSVGLPGAFTEWPPWVQATALGLATFVQEDIPTVTAALLVATGQLPLWVGFLGCFLGIWIGDALLYGAARGLGRPLLERRWIRRWVSLESVARSEQWFAEKGTWLLLSSRFIPGTRLPTYLAAGFLRLSFPRFLLVTGAAVAVWTALLFGLAHLLGSQLRGWLDRWNSAGVGASAWLAFPWAGGLESLAALGVLAGLVVLSARRSLVRHPSVSPSGIDGADGGQSRHGDGRFCRRIKVRYPTRLAGNESGIHRDGRSASGGIHARRPVGTAPELDAGVATRLAHHPET